MEVLLSVLLLIRWKKSATEASAHSESVIVLATVQPGPELGFAQHLLVLDFHVG